MSNRYAVILAAGQGTRMKSKLYKVLHPVCGKPMVQHIVDQVSQLKINKSVTIIGHGAEQVKACLGGKMNYALQAEQLGTAHAVMQAANILSDKEGTTVVLCGDTPLLRAETLQQLFDHHENIQAGATVLTAKIDDPTDYGRIVRDENNLIEKIVEQKDATVEEQLINEINTGTYCFDNRQLFAALQKVSNDNSQGEYYLPDVIEIIKGSGGKVSAYQAEDYREILGVNDRVALAEAEKIMRNRINEQHLINGVTIINPEATYIDADVIIGQDTVIYPGTSIVGNTTIGNDCNIGPNSQIVNCKIANNSLIDQSVIKHSSIGANVSIGPFAHIRPDTTIKDEVKIGNFVEVKNTLFGKGSKASHLSYLGDAEIGENVNIGCGSITVNYDGKDKHLTKIADDVFIGCNSNLIAPVKISQGAYIAAGSTITADVPSEALSIARARQVNKEGYVKKLNLKK